MNAFTSKDYCIFLSYGFHVKNHTRFEKSHKVDVMMIECLCGKNVYSLLFFLVTVYFQRCLWLNCMELHSFISASFGDINQIRRKVKNSSYLFSCYLMKSNFVSVLYTWTRSHTQNACGFGLYSRFSNTAKTLTLAFSQRQISVRSFQLCMMTNLHWALDFSYQFHWPS